jgi:uncharacterized protein
MHYKERTYRHRILAGRLTAYEVVVRETDLLIRSDKNLSNIATDAVIRQRRFLEAYISRRPAFLTSLVPLEADSFAPAIVREMLDAAWLAHVGPMAAVAGAIAQFVGSELLDTCDNVIVENGGDIFLSTAWDTRIGVFAGSSPLSDKVSIVVRANEMPLGICTSSGTVGPSLSYGRADAVCIKSPSAVIADAAATAVGNRMKKKQDMEAALRHGVGIAGVSGVLIIMGDRLGAIGAMELTD